jgi:hypothetical protein
MEDRKTKAAEYRRQASLCLEVAERMSVRADRESMMQMAEHWLALAREMELEADD